ncbi:MAG: MFS transporter [Rhizobiaceae bacterium]|jgi:DHA1 family bicyclomycin/chloramphenicol resistance-like MFS transporter|nr:MFS transporter [Rhizobiaceae bacterium]
MRTPFTRERQIVLYAGLLSSLSAFSIDITLPAIPQMADDLAAPVATVQLTISLYILGLGLGQFVWGVLSDRFGRMPAIAAGLVIYLTGALAAFAAPNGEALIAARLLQGFGGAAATVSARAMIRDVSTGNALASNMALATAVFAIGPIVAPFLGVGLIAFFGWRALFMGLGALAALLLAALVFVGETSTSRTEISRAGIGASVRAIMVHPQSRFFLLYGPVAMATMIFILSMLPAVYASAYGVTGFAFAALFALHGLGIVAGQLMNRRLIGTVGPAGSMLRGAIVLCVASGLMLAVSLAGFDTAVVISALLILFATSYLVVMANASSLLLDPHGRIAGFAAALSMGVAQLGAGALVSALVHVLPVTPLAFSATLFALCAAALLPPVIWSRRQTNVHSGTQIR